MTQSENDASSAGDGGDIEANDTASNGSDKNLLVSRGIRVEADSDSERSLDCSRCCSSFGICGWASGVIIFVALTLGLLIASFRKLESTEYGLQYHPRRKELDEAAKTGGLHVGPPGFEFVQFPSTYITVNLNDGRCVSRDGLRVAFDVTFQYQMPEIWVLPATLQYRNFEKWAQVVEAAGMSAVQHTCSDFQISNFQNKRGLIQTTMEDNLRIKLEGQEEDGSDGVFALAISLQLSNVDLPEEYSEAVAEKQSAAEDISLAQNQRTQEITKARTAFNTAKEEARKLFDNALNDANVTLTEASLKAEETLFRFGTERTILLGVQEKLGLTTQGLLAYLSNRLYAEAPYLAVAAEEPVQLSRKQEL